LSAALADSGSWTLLLLLLVLRSAPPPLLLHVKKPCDVRDVVKSVASRSK
jgi:hypothetical protein